MSLTGLTGAPIIRGNGQIDVGLTESIGKLIGRDQNNVIPGQNSTSSVLSNVPFSTPYTGALSAYTSFTTPRNSSQQAQSGRVQGVTDDKTSQVGGGGGGGGGGAGGGSGAQNNGPQRNGNTVSYINEFGKLVTEQVRNAEPDYSQMISELYDPALQLANQMEGSVRSAFEGDKSNLLNRIAQSLGEYQQQGQQLLGAADDEQSQFNKTIESALSQAVRSYNALNQRGQVLYGGATSAGQALGELAAREFARQQGTINDRLAQGTKQFADERMKIKTYIDSKVKDLDLYKQEALTALEQNLKSQLDSIAARRYDIEANRTRDKMAALQNTIDRTRAIQDQDKAFRQNLAMAGLQQLQEISGRTFTPTEIKAYMSEFASDLSVNPQTQTGNQLVEQLRRNPSQYEDEFNTLNPAASQKTKQQTTPSKPNTSSYIAQLMDQQQGQVNPGYSFLG